MVDREKLKEIILTERLMSIDNENYKLVSRVMLYSLLYILEESGEKKLDKVEKMSEYILTNYESLLEEVKKLIDERLESGEIKTIINKGLVN